MKGLSLRLDPETEEQLRQDARRMAQEAWHEVQVLEAQLTAQHRLKALEAVYTSGRKAR